MKKYVAPSMEEIRLVSLEHITSSVDGSGAPVATKPTRPNN